MINFLRLWEEKIFPWNQHKLSLDSKDVKHVPNILLNLVFIVLLNNDDYITVFSSDKWKFTRSSPIITRGKKENTLYMTTTKVRNGCVNALRDDSLIELWHKRLRHISERGLRTLAKRETLIGVKGKIVCLLNHICTAWLESNIKLHSIIKLHKESPMFCMCILILVVQWLVVDFISLVIYAVFIDISMYKHGVYYFTQFFFFPYVRSVIVGTMSLLEFPCTNTEYIILLSVFSFLM